MGIQEKKMKNDLRYYGNPMTWPEVKGDLISRAALKAYAREVLCGDKPTDSLLIRMFDEIIDNAPTVKPEQGKLNS